MKAVHNIWRPLAAVLVVGGLVGATAWASRPGPSASATDVKAVKADGAVLERPAGSGSTAGVDGLEYQTGFEFGDDGNALTHDGFVARDETCLVCSTAGTACTAHSDCPSGEQCIYNLAAGPPCVSGYINDQPAGPDCPGAAGPDCWAVTTAGDRSLREGHVSIVNPFTGTQHLRLSHDPTTRVNADVFTTVGVDARLPSSADAAANPSPLGRHTTDFDLAMVGFFASDFRLQMQDLGTNGLASNITIFYYDGTIFTRKPDADPPTACVWAPVGSWDSTGAYRHLRVDQDPCRIESGPSGTTYDGVIDTYYDGALISHDFQLGVCIGGFNVDQMLAWNSNWAGTDEDIDNMVLEAYGPCPQVCGNGLLEGTEECDGTDNDDACPGLCRGVGDPDGECSCIRSCTFDAPCPLGNGDNGPYLTSGGYYTFTPDAPFISMNGCQGDDDSALLVYAMSDLATPIAVNDDCNAGAYGAGSDPSAPCFGGAGGGNQFGSCVCFANPGEPVLVWKPHFSGNPPVAGTTQIIQVEKKSVCGGPRVGSCCDTNGLDGDPFGCVDNVLQADCMGAYDTWTESGKCADIVCDCIPDCAGATCGDNGCGGSCGDCDDGDACNGMETCNAGRTCDAGTPVVCTDGNACNGLETCDSATGACVGGTPINCSNGQACDGVETCNPSNGACIPGTPVNCDDGVACTVDTCVEPGGTCVNDDSDCAIPTVSEWGLVVLALMLLIGAKVYFGRRQVIA
jgi:hypothetical protein